MAKNFLHLPAEVFEMISKNVDLKARLCLRKTCNKFKQFVDISRYGGNFLAMDVDRSRIRVEFDGHEVEYWDMGVNCWVLHQGAGRLIRGSHFVELACADLRTVLGTSNTSIYLASIQISRDAGIVGRQVIGLMENFYVAPASFKITKLEVLIEDNTLFLPILSLMSPDNLKSVTLINEGEMQFGQIIHTPQWLNLRAFEQKGNGSVSPDILQSVGHLAEFEIRSPLSTQQGIDLLEVLVRSETFESCQIIHMNENFDSGALGNILGLELNEEDEGEFFEEFEIDGNPNFWHIAANELNFDIFKTNYSGEEE